MIKDITRAVELKTGIEMGVEIMVAIPGVASFAPDDNYNFDKFVYNPGNDTYTCPEGKTLITNGNWYIKTKQRYIYHVKHYKTHDCKGCPALALCTKNKKGRLIERSEYQPYMEQNKQNIQKDPATYKKRQAIIEHTYGIIKRQWGFYFVSTKKGIKHASADVGLMFTALNLRRLMNILDKNVFVKFLRELAQTFFAKTAPTKAFLTHLSTIFFQTVFTSRCKTMPLYASKSSKPLIRFEMKNSF